MQVFIKTFCHWSILNSISQIHVLKQIQLLSQVRVFNSLMITMKAW